MNHRAASSTTYIVYIPCELRDPDTRNRLRIGPWLPFIIPCGLAIQSNLVVQTFIRHLLSAGNVQPATTFK